MALPKVELSKGIRDALTSAQEFVDAGKCPICESDIRAEDFRSRADVEKYRTTGLCPTCIFDLKCME